MGSVAGVELKYAAKKQGTGAAGAWGTPVACGANDGFLALATSLKRSADLIVDDSLGTFHVTDGTPGAVKVEGDIPAYLRYDNFDMLLAMFMGTTGGAPTTHTGGSAAKDWSQRWNMVTDGFMFTFAKHLKNYIAEFPSCKVTKLTIKGEVGKPIQVTFGIIANNVNFNVGTGTNTTTTFNSVTVKEIQNRVQFGQAVFRLNSQTGAALGAGDKVYPIAFELVAERKLTGQYGQFTTGVAGNLQEVIDEPTNDGKPNVTLKLTFPRHSSETRLTALTQDSRLKGDIVFTGKIIEGAIPRMFAIQFPNLQYKNVDIADANGIIQEPVEFQVLAASTAPAGMTSADTLPTGKVSGFNITDPFVLSGINQNTADPLA